jgi:D-lactate dehydrogenase
LKIAVFDAGTYRPAAFEALAREHQAIVVDSAMTDSDIPSVADAEVLSTFAYTQLNRTVLQRFGRLRLIATQSTGYDHIDLGYCRERGISVANVPAYGAQAVAEHTFALLLALGHRLEDAISVTRTGRFDSRHLEGFDLAGKTLGVIGTGAIGRNVIRIARGFAMEVLAYDIRQDDAIARTLGFSYVSFTELITKADIITLHIPATPETIDLISTAAIARMKPGVIIINTARGSLIEETALIRALNSRQVAAAGLDVLRDEASFRDQNTLAASPDTPARRLATLAENHILCSMPHVVVTPHSAFYTREAILRISDETVENILAFARGEARNIVLIGSTAAV